MILSGSKDKKNASGWAGAEVFSEGLTKERKTRTVFYTQQKPNYEPLTTMLHEKRKNSF